MQSTYNPKEFENKWYEFWLAQDLFTAKPESGKPPYTVLMPPPNVTAQLHMGHGTGYTMQDIMIRWKRMAGYDALWLPGTDHAGIATQMMVERDLLEKEGLTRQELGREKFLERLHAWKDKYGSRIVEQFKAMGFSCDWSRLAYTMDEGLSLAVRHIFVKLHKDGLIYRGERLVNWDPVLKTAISDDEVYSEEIAGFLYHIRYPLVGSNEFLVVATTRPETMLGDVAVAVHPDDDRYRHLVGTKVRLPLTEREIPIIADAYVKMEFGTGCVKITPAHDPNDFAIGKRHELPMINIFNPDATINDLAPEPFRGLDRFKARQLVVKRLKELELLEKEEKHKHAVPHSDRSKAIIEPRLSLQWFVNMQGLAQPAIEAAKSQKLNFHPESWRKTYFYWLENIQDWCISRQLWWGHRIPIWECKDCKAHTCELTDPTRCGTCGSENISQDEDVLDTWFSSWLWPVSTLGWPEDDKDLKRYYPTDVLITAPEILFLWVARMVMVGYYTKSAAPFKDVFLTATVCDEKGRKFSKTLGNGIDPMDVIEKHGTDAVRFTGVHLAPLGGRIRMGLADFEVGAKFINKIWNAARFLMANIPTSTIAPLPERTQLPLYQQWLLTSFEQTALEVNESLASYRINDAVHAIYHFIWGNLCDWALEIAKDTLKRDPQSDAERMERDATHSVLVYVFDGALRLASPIMPFVTEEIWQNLPKHPNWDRPVSLCIAHFPEGSRVADGSLIQSQWQKIADLISGIRTVRSQATIPPKMMLSAYLYTQDDNLIGQHLDIIKKLAKLSEIEINSAASPPAKCLVAIGRGFQCYLPASGLMDIKAELTRLQSEKTRIEKVIAGIDSKLANQNFVANAPAEVIEQNREQQRNLMEQIQHLEANLKSLQG